MENVIIILILVMVVALGIGSTIKHFQGQGGCCGGGTYKPKKKKLSKVLYKKTFKVGGMHCENCSARVQRYVNELEHVAGVVNLKKGILTVSYENELDDSVVMTAVEKAGYSIMIIE